MSESELYQLELLWKLETTRAQYERVVAGKSAALFEASCRTPCYLAGLSAPVTQAFGEYGRALGFAFQIADDCLDYEGDEEAVGKTITADLQGGKVTLPLILALQNALEGGQRFADFRDLVSGIIETGEADARTKSRLVEGVHATGGLLEAKSIAMSYAQKGRDSLLEALRGLPTRCATTDATASMLAVLEFVTERKN